MYSTQAFAHITSEEEKFLLADRKLCLFWMIGGLFFCDIIFPSHN